MTTSHLRLASLALGAAAVVTLSGCSPATPIELEELTPDQTAFIERAQEGGASDEQVQILVDSFHSGELSYQQLADATSATLACFEEAGIPTSHWTVQVGPGVDNIEYNYGAVPGLSGEESLAIADSCIYAHSFFVEVEYSNQPDYEAAVKSRLDEARPALIACLEDDGAVVDAGAPTEGLIAQALDRWAAGGPDCYGRAGLD